MVDRCDKNRIVSMILLCIVFVETAIFIFCLQTSVAAAAHTEGTVGEFDSDGGSGGGGGGSGGGSDR